MTIKPYTTYKETNLSWLPKVPEHWAVVKTKHLFKERVQKGFESEPLLAATQTQGVIPKELYETRTVTAQKDFHLLKLVKINDFVISLRSFQGGIEYAYYQGIISPAYTVMKPASKIDTGFYRFLFKSVTFIQNLTTFVTGIREGQNINYGEFKNSNLPFPPLKEQTVIAEFLDQKTSQIEIAVAKKKQLIELLKEQKQAMINKAVTQGLNANSDRWERKKLKYVVKNSSEQTDILKEGETYLGMENIESKTGKFIPTTEKNTLDSQGKKFVKNQVLFGKLRPYLAKVWLAEFSGVCSGEFLTFNVLKGNEPKYFQLRLLTKSFIDIIDSSTYGTKMPRADWGFIGNQIIAIPPLAEQQEIVNYIEQESQQSDRTINQIEREIELLKEYRTTLIANAVTGRIKVI